MSVVREMRASSYLDVEINGFCLDVKLSRPYRLPMPDHVDAILVQWNRERPDLDVGPMGTFGRLKRLNDELSEAIARPFKAHGLTSAGFDVLATLRRSGEPYSLSPSALIATTMVTSGTMTNRLDRLEEAGLIERRRDPQDGRGFLVALTPAGFELVDRVVSEHVANQHRLIAGLSPALRDGLDAALRDWLASFETGRGDASDKG
ncbi:transcriptional regulator, MarR family [Fulvimarina manganoxydans]|uniref:Transcriptional regulator, MarR family n=2 Tax=Fulvimarina manganoxydans TaxID=937218 RepID=A0A1W2D9M9_9HYPH|nr:transcriptional regulator, MarR family [Fulvimarina manganoxydans]